MRHKPEEILRIAREKKKLTQDDMADKLGISLRQYHKYESGNFPKYKSEKIKQIDAILGINLYEHIYEQKFEDDLPNRFDINIQHIKELTKDVKEIKATVYVLKVTVAQLAATSSGKAIGSMLVEIDRAIAEKADNLYDEDKKNQERV
jgi:transcriptional regulator with XRE-family HTH domain